MNERFKRLIKEKGWQERSTPIRDYMQRETGRFGIDYIKVFTMPGAEGPKNVPVSVSFWSYNKDFYPSEAIFRFVLKPELQPSSRNAVTTLRGVEKIICLIDQAGMLEAMKFELYSSRAAIYKSLSKKELHKYNALPI